jgi:predicted nucleic acid-binding Zn ribbon protein
VKRPRYALPERIGSEIGAAAPARIDRLRRVTEAWVDVVGAALAGHAEPVRLTEGGVVVIHAADASWAQAIELERRRILAGLTTRLDPGTVTELRVAIGPLRSR